MSVFSTFVDAFKKAVDRKRAADLETARSSGGTLGSTPAGNAGAFDPLRPAPEPDTGNRVDLGVNEVSSGDPEEGGEVLQDVKRADVDRGDAAVSS
jgi:hypothetical protein